MFAYGLLQGTLSTPTSLFRAALRVAQKPGARQRQETTSLPSVHRHPRAVQSVFTAPASSQALCWGLGLPESSGTLSTVDQMTHKSETPFPSQH